MTDSESFPCLNCDNPSTSQCSQCRAVRFCNRDCQKKSWKIHKAFCKGVSSNTVSPVVAYVTTPLSTCLLVDGMGPLGPGEGYMQGAKEALLGAGVHVSVVDVTKGAKIPEQLAAVLKTRQFQAMIMLGFGSGGGDIDMEIASSTLFRDASRAWCRDGGRFIVQGERLRAMKNWPSWFDKEWKDGGYFRTDHQCFAVGPSAPHWCRWYEKAADTVVGNYNVKAVMLNNVPPSEMLHGAIENADSMDEGSTAVAWGKFGNGTVSFFGDVNWEKDTLTIMAIVARGRFEEMESQNFSISPDSPIGRLERQEEHKS